MSGDPKVREQGGYSDSGVGPQTDAASWDTRTPLGGDTYRDTQERAPEQPVYVTDELNAELNAELNEEQRKATPPGMLSRAAVRSSAAPSAEQDEGVENTTRVFVAGGVAFVVLLILGGLGIYANYQTIEKIENQAEAAHAAKPQLPDDVQGVRVRKGLQHAPNQPAKLPGETINDENPAELNEVPDGAPPPPAQPLSEPTAVPDGSPE